MSEPDRNALGVRLKVGHQADLEHRLLAPGAPHAAPGVADLAEGDAVADGVDDHRHQVPALGRGRLGELGEPLLDHRGVASRLERLEPLDLPALDARIDAEDLDLLLALGAEPVDADDNALLGVDLLLVAEGGVGDLIVWSGAMRSAPAAPATASAAP